MKLKRRSIQSYINDGLRLFYAIKKVLFMVTLHLYKSLQIIFLYYKKILIKITPSLNIVLLGACYLFLL